jgi:hypothetical protein
LETRKAERARVLEKEARQLKRIRKLEIREKND